MLDDAVPVHSSALHQSRVPLRAHRVSMQDGLTVFVRDYGNRLSPATPLLCLAGLTRNGRDFRLLAEALAPTRRVVCLDYIGRGSSDRSADWRRYEPTRMAADIATVVTALNLHGLAVLGTSFGGIMAAALCTSIPTAVHAVILNEAAPELNVTAIGRIQAQVATPHEHRSAEAALSYLKAQFPHLGFEEEADWQLFLDGTYAKGGDGTLRTDWDPKIAETMGAPIDKSMLWRLFRSINPRPVLAFRGQNSDVVTPAAFSAMSAALHNIEAICVPNRAHVPTLHEAQALEPLKAFLTALDRERETRYHN